MDSRTDAINVEKLLQVLRRRWPLLVLCLVIAGGAAFAVSEQQTKKYTASVALLFRSPGLDQQASGLQPVSTPDPQRGAATNVKLVKLGDVAVRTARTVGHGITPEEVSRSITVTAEGQTDIAKVSSTWTDPLFAARISNTFAQRFIDIRRETDQGNVARALQLVDRQLAGLTPQQKAGIQGQALVDRSESLRVLSSLQTGNAEIAERATPPTTPSSPKTTRNTVLGLVLGLMLGVGLAALLERLDRRVKDASELADVYALPLLGTVPLSRSFAKLAAPSSAGHSPSLPRHESEVFHLLRARLRYFNVDQDVRSVAVVSSSPGEGKTTVVHHLAAAAAAMGSNVLIVETDLRKPTLARRLGVSSDRGLTDLLIGRTDPREAVQTVTFERLSTGGGSADTPVSIIVAGATPPNPAELLESRAMESVMMWAAERYDLVLVDTPPLGVVSDAIPLLGKVDGVIVVSRLGTTTRDGAARMREELDSLRAPSLGVVANASKQHQLTDYDYYTEPGKAAPDPQDRAVNGRRDPAVVSRLGGGRG